jgi:hypothetical protein
VPQYGQGLGIPVGQNAEIPAAAEGSGEVLDLAFYFNRDRIPQQPGPYRCHDVARGRAFGSFTGGAVGEPQRQHFLVLIRVLRMAFILLPQKLTACSYPSPQAPYVSLPLS